MTDLVTYRGMLLAALPALSGFVHESREELQWEDGTDGRTKSED